MIIRTKMTMKRRQTMRVKMLKFSHRDFLGAHRYTTIGGTVRPAGGSPLRSGRCRADVPRTSCTLRTALPASQSKGERYTFSAPLRSAQSWRPPDAMRPFGGLRPPTLFVYFASDEALKSRASPSTKSAVVTHHHFSLPWQMEGGTHGS